MNHRDRILTALEHREPDKIPFDLGSTLVTGITKNAYINLVKYMGKESKGIRLFDVIQQLVSIEENVLTKLEVDTRGLMPNIRRKNPYIKEDNDFWSFTDEWEIMWKMPKEKGFYFDITKSPLDGNITVEDIDDFPWPDPANSYLLQGLKERAKKYYENGYAVILESFCSGIFEMSCRIRGYEQFYFDLATNPKLACKLMDKILELKIQFYKMVSKEMGHYIQFIREGDDIAGQEALLISPQMYRKYIKPRHKELFKAQKEIFPPPFYCFFHSDGAIYDLIPDFIEIGVEILNPIQASARGMNIAKLKKEFGKDISFWGGGIDTQKTLPKGTPEEVKEEVKKRIEVLAPGGGFIFGAVHNIQDDVPAENIMAMWEAFQKLRNY
ncbi:hypothetical protein J7K43_05225 [Candidatus Calescamantes bacterium]|nr:hypothetical protein [Candidatus Calescamantes bacterium]